MNVIAFTRLKGLEIFFPTILILGPWSGDILIKGKPKVIFIASYSYKVFIGVNTWCNNYAAKCSDCCIKLSKQLCKWWWYRLCACGYIKFIDSNIDIQPCAIHHIILAGSGGVFDWVDKVLQSKNSLIMVKYFLEWLDGEIDISENIGFLDHNLSLSDQTSLETY